MPDATSASPKTYQCRHLFTDGHRCGSKSLRHEEFCFYHHKTRKPFPKAAPAPPAEATFDLPFPEDRAAIQLSIGEVLQRIARNEIDPRRAGLLLYGLQIASLNLPKPTSSPIPYRYSSRGRTRYPEQEEPETPEDIVADPTHGPLAPIAEYREPEERHSIVGDLLRLIGDDPDTVDNTLPTLQACHPAPPDNRLTHPHTHPNAKPEPIFPGVPGYGYNPPVGLDHPSPSWNLISRLQEQPMTRSKHRPTLALALCALSSLGTASAATFDGTWHIKGSVQDNPVNPICILAEKDGKLTGTCTGTDGKTVAITGTVKDKQIKWQYDTLYQGGGITISFTGKLDQDDHMAGGIYVDPYAVDGSFTATRDKPAATPPTAPAPSPSSPPAS